MRFRFIEGHREVFLVRVMCSVLHVSASGYYAWRGRPESARAQANRALVEDIRRVHASSRRRYGSPRVHASLQAEGKRVGCNRVTRLMHEHGIQAHRRRPFRKTTDSNHAFPPAPNLLDRQFASAVAPNQVWLADMTYIATGEGWLYLAAILDLFSRKIVGWAMSETMPQELTLAALHMAITNRNPGPGLLHHSDRGSQYAAHAYRRAQCWSRACRFASPRRWRTPGCAAYWSSALAASPCRSAAPSDGLALLRSPADGSGSTWPPWRTRRCGAG